MFLYIYIVGNNHASVRILKLYEDGKRIQEKKKILKQNYVSPDETFTPSITPKGRDCDRHSDGFTPRHEILYNQAELQQKKLREKSLELDKDCTFKPNTNSKKGRGQRPLSAKAKAARRDNRFNELYKKATDQHKRKLKRMNSLDKECTFKPKLNKLSVSLHKLTLNLC